MRWFERLLAGLVLGALSLALLGPAIASGSGSLASEWTEEWCIGCGVSLGAASVYDVSYGDLDGDGVPQIVTAGENLWQNQVSPFQWFQSVFTRYSKVQYGDGGSRLTGVAVGNFAGGSGLEVATVEVDPIGTSDSKGTLRLWQWGLGSLAEIVEGRAEWHDGTGMVAEDIAAMPPGPDGHQDVVTISHYNAFSGGRLWSEVSRWSWASVPAVRVASNAVPDVELHAVALGDTDGDTILNVVGAGFHLVSSPPPSHEGELSVWRLDTAGFALVAERQWPGGSATGFSFEGVTLSNVDTDATVEIVTAGGADFAQTSEYAEVAVFAQTGVTITWEAGQTIAQMYFMDVAAGNLDQEPSIESVTVGVAHAPGTYGTFSIWRHGSGSISEQDREQTDAGGQLQTVTIGDIDDDGITEFLIGGSRQSGLSPRWSQLGIWSWSTAPATDDWPMFQKTPQHDGNSPSVGPTSDSPFWSKTLSGGSNQFYHTQYSPVIYGGRVFTRVQCQQDDATGNWCIYSYDLLTGALVWGPVRSWVDIDLRPAALAVANGRVFYTGTSLDRAGFPPGYTGIFGALDASTGVPIWPAVQIAGQSLTLAPTASGGRVWFAGEDRTSRINYVYAYDFQGGRVLTFSPGPSSEKVWGGSISEWRDRAFIRSTTKLFAIPNHDADGVVDNPGDIWWSFNLGSANLHYEWTESSPTIVSQSVLNVPVVFIGGHDSPDYPTSPGGRVFALRADATPADKVIDRTDPEFIWMTDQLQSYVSSTAAVSSDRLYVGADYFDPAGVTSRGYLYAIDISTHSVVWSEQFKSPLVASSPALSSNGLLYILAPTRSADIESSQLVFLQVFTTAHVFLWKHVVEDFSGQATNYPLGASPSIASGKVCAGNYAPGLRPIPELNAQPFIYCFG